MTLPKEITYSKAMFLPFRVTPLETALQLFTQLISLVIAPVQVLVTAYFINTALTAFNEGADFNRVVPPLIAMAAFQVYNFFLNPFMGLVEKRREIKTRLALRVPFVEKRMRLEYKHLENKDTIDLTKRVWNNPEDRLSNIWDNMVQFIVMVGQSVSYIVILLVNAPLAGLLLIVLSVPIFYMSHKSGKQKYQAGRDMTKIDRMYWTLFWYLTSRDTVAERNLFGYSEFINAKFMDNYEKSRRYKFNVDLKWYVRGKSSSIILGLLSSAALFMLAPSLVNGGLSVGLYISLLGALFGTINAIGWSLSYYFQQFAEQREYLKDLNQFLALSETPDADALPAKVAPPFTSLIFDKVSFSYPGTEKKILDEVSFRIEKNKHYSFVGVNGAGKTTLTKLITRLYDDYTGEILLNGKSLREYPIAEIKAMFCAVFQDFAHYDVTVAENVAIGKINDATDAEIDNALRLSGFEDKLKELKNRKDTLLGKTQDASVDLSGGEWQRIAFARTIISPSPVKILDEPTAALDPVAESKMYAQFEEISRGITTIFISHRLASAKMADIIFVLDGGKIVEQGSHAVLMQADGLYAAMFESQRSWYN